jgi:hypothetical protein
MRRHRSPCLIEQAKKRGQGQNSLSERFGTTIASVAAALTVPSPDPEKIIEQARSLERRMIESNKPKPLKDIVLITKDEVQQTRAALESIDRAAPQYAEAQKLLASIKKSEDAGKRAMEAFIAKAKADDVEGRKAYATELERNFLRGGYDINVSLSGSKGTILTLHY